MLLFKYLKNTYYLNDEVNVVYFSRYQSNKELKITNFWKILFK